MAARRAWGRAARRAAGPYRSCRAALRPSRCRPSGWLALEIDAPTADPERLDDAELVESIVAFDRVASWASARQARLLGEFARRRPGDDPQAISCDNASHGSRYAPDEIGLALGLSRGAAMARLGQAVLLAGPLQATLACWERGQLDGPKVRAITDTCAWLPAAQATAVQDRVLRRAPDQTLPQLRAALARSEITVDPAGAAERHQQAHRQRRVWVNQEPDAMATLWAMLSAPDAVSAYEWLTRLPRGLGAGDPRGMDARRADLLVELLTGRLSIDADSYQAADTPDQPVEPDQAAQPDPTGAPDELDEPDQPNWSARPAQPAPRRPVGHGKPLIQVIMPWTTLTGAAEQPGELVGYGPVPAPLAREIAADAVWKRLVTDPLSGTLLDYGRTTYQPPIGLADHVRVRDLHCRFPTCQRAAASSELDYTRAFHTAGGTTSETNLATGCLHHHRLKHHAGWTVTQHPDGRLVWTTPTGHSYTSRPHDYRPQPPDDPLPPPRPVAASPAVPPRAPAEPDPPPF